jgi:hypothetical protein
MAFLITYVITIIMSYGIDVSIFGKICKDLADMGYKMDAKRYSEVTKELYPEQMKNSKIIPFIPFLNVLIGLVKLDNYNRTKEEQLSSIRALACIEEMTDEEKEEYAKNPTTKHALKKCVVYVGKKLMDEHDYTLVINHNDGIQSIIKYHIIDKKVIINSVVGPYKVFHDKELKRIILKATIGELISKPSEKKVHGIIKSENRVTNSSDMEINDSIFETKDLGSMGKFLDVVTKDLTTDGEVRMPGVEDYANMASKETFDQVFDDIFGPLKPKMENTTPEENTPVMESKPGKLLVLSRRTNNRSKNNSKK